MVGMGRVEKAEAEAARWTRKGGIGIPIVLTEMGLVVLGSLSWGEV